MSIILIIQFIIGFLIAILSQAYKAKQKEETIWTELEENTDDEIYDDFWDFMKKNS